MGKVLKILFLTELSVSLSSRTLHFLSLKTREQTTRECHPDEQKFLLELILGSIS